MKNSTKRLIAFLKSAGILKLLKIMKISTILLIFFTFQIFAEGLYSQQAKLTLNLGETSVGEVLTEIENQSEFYFLFNQKLVDTERKVTIRLFEKNIGEILDQLFGNTNIDYVVMDRQIVLSPKEYLLEVKSSLQEQPVTGVVTDENGDPLIGVTVLLKETNEGTITDINGKFALSGIPANGILIFSYVGMKTQEINVSGKTSLKVILEEEIHGIAEVVAIGYGTQRKGNITGAISSVKSEDLTATPKSNSTNALIGKLPGLITQQTSGMPGFDAADISIRGFGNALVIVDGIESGIETLDPNEIESVSILKDGSASIYGSRAGNGVILVTTKRGNLEKPTITVSSSYTGQGVTRMARPPSAGQYTEMTSEAWIQAGKPTDLAPFSPEEIAKYYDGTDPQYPNTDWYKELIRNFAPMLQNNVSLRGGSEKIKYYGFLGNTYQETMWKNNGGNYNRYNFRSNIDAKILDNLTLRMDVASIVEDRKFPLRMSGPEEKGVWQDYWTTRPIYPASLPDPEKYSYADGTGTGGVHITSNMERAGYNQRDNNQFSASGALEYGFKKINGLSARAFFHINKDFNNGKAFAKPYKFYEYDVESDTYTFKGASGQKAALSVWDNRNRMLNSQLSLNYENNFNNTHYIKALALYEITDYRSDYLSASRRDFISEEIEELFGGSTEDMVNDGSATEMGRKSIVARFNYSYKRKYLLESTIRADASAKFPEDTRWGYFPSVSLGWLISEESFMEQITAFEFLKLRASYGSAGNDGVGNFQYLSGYELEGNYTFGDERLPGIISTGLANPGLTWEEFKIYNLGVDFSAWNKNLYGEGDIFYRERSGIPATRIGTVPSTFGASLPPENLNSMSTRGFEYKLGTSGRLNRLIYDFNGYISWARSRWIHFDEPEFLDPDQERIKIKTGEWTDRRFGYLSDGLFTSMEEIENLEFDQDKTGNSTLRPGDIKYVDVNKDGVLDWKDQVEIGKGTKPLWIFGMNLNLNYRNFFLTALFQGAFDYYKDIILIYTSGEIMPPAVVYDLRWTEETNDPNALIPRLGGAKTNELISDYRFKKAGYLRLKDLSFGYDVPSKFLTKVNMKALKVYIAGTNLLTFDRLKDYGIDPEAPSGNQQSTWYYPQQRTLSMGLTLSF